MCFHCTLLYPCFLPFLFLTMHFASWPKLNISISLCFPFNLKSEVLLFCFIIEKSLNHYFVIPVMFTCNFFLSSVFLLLFSLYLFSNVAYHLQALRGLYKGLEICYSLMFLWMDYVFVVIQLALFSVIFSQSLFHVFFFFFCNSYCSQKIMWTWRWISIYKFYLIFYHNICLWDFYLFSLF